MALHSIATDSYFLDPNFAVLILSCQTHSWHFLWLSLLLHRITLMTWTMETQPLSHREEEMDLWEVLPHWLYDASFSIHKSILMVSGSTVLCQILENYQVLKILALERVTTII